MFVPNVDTQRIRALPFLKFNILEVDSTSGNYERERAEYGLLEITILKDRHLLICGSLHKHTKGHNHSDFSAFELSQAIGKLCNDLALDPNKVEVQNIELGVNIEPPIATTRFLDSIFLYKCSRFETHYFSGHGYMLLFKGCNYLVKVYDKAKETNARFEKGTFSRGEHLVRFEIRIKKMEHLKTYNICRLSDLQDSRKLESLEKLLQQTLENVIMGESITNLKGLTKTEKRFKEAHEHRSHWEQLELNMVPYKRRRLRKIDSRTSPHTVHAFFKDAVVLKWRKLMKVVPVLTDIIKG